MKPWPLQTAVYLENGKWPTTTLTIPVIHFFEWIRFTYGPGVESIHDVVSKKKNPKNIHVSCSRASRAGSASGSDSLKSADSNQYMYWLYWQPYNQSNSSWNETQKHLTNCHSRIVKRVTADLVPCTWRNGSKVILVLFYLFWQNLHLSSLSHSCFTLMHADLLWGETLAGLSSHEYSHQTIRIWVVMYVSDNKLRRWLDSALQQPAATPVFSCSFHQVYLKHGIFD